MKIQKNKTEGYTLRSAPSEAAVAVVVLIVASGALLLLLTDLTRPLSEDAKFDAWVKSEVPLRRWGEPGDLVGLAVMLASPASDYISGQTIYVDGGWQACL